jgi:hypothetical protein
MFFITVKDHKPERLLSAMYFILPPKVSFNCKVNSQAASRDWLSISLEFYSRHLMDKLVKNFP